MSALAKRLDELESQFTAKTGDSVTVVGIVSASGDLLRCIKKQGKEWQETIEAPDCYLAEKLEKVLKSNKRFIVVIGGRGSGKSLGVGDICLIDAKDTNTKTFCLRQYQSSIEDSVHSLLKEEIGRLDFDGFDVNDKKIRVNGLEAFKFSGIERTGDSIKSAHGFKRFWIEEAQFISQDSINILTPTARNKARKGLPNQVVELEQDNLESVSMVFVANPSSSESPFSQRFIKPYESQIAANGFYEDDLHLIVKMDYSDNPWFSESGLEEERQWDYENKPRALYNHIWQGAYNDSIENALILDEWFDACIDAHIKLGFKPEGARLGAHDPSDGQQDTKGLALRHGSVVFDVREKDEGNVNEGCDWAIEIARDSRLDSFTWDCDGMGIALQAQVSKGFANTATGTAMFKGSESPDFPNTRYRASTVNPDTPISDQPLIKDAFRNKRAQYYFELRDRVYRTYRAVIHGDYCDPDKMISFSSDIKLLGKLRSELCRMPIKPNTNGKFELYTKDEMKSKFKLNSPNLGDSVMMLMRYINLAEEAVYIPKPIRPMGR